MNILYASFTPPEVIKNSLRDYSHYFYFLTLAGQNLKSLSLCIDQQTLSSPLNAAHEEEIAALVQELSSRRMLVDQGQFYVDALKIAHVGSAYDEVLTATTNAFENIWGHKKVFVDPSRYKSF